jgi:hypothetical protein
VRQFQETRIADQFAIPRDSLQLKKIPCEPDE